MRKRLTVNWILFFIILFAFFVRIIGVFYPIPFSNDADNYLRIAMKFGRGDLNPHYFTHPHFTFYITFFAEILSFTINYIFGFIQSLADFTLAYLCKHPVFLIAGRIPSLFFGMGTVYLVYLIGLKNWGDKIGLYAACMLAVVPLHVLESQTIRIRGVATFFGILSLFFIFRILKNNRKRDYIFSGLSFGASIACEYTMVFFVFPLIAVSIITYKARKRKNTISRIYFGKRLLLYFVFAIGVFVSCSPYTFFDYPANFKAIKDNFALGGHLLQVWDSAHAKKEGNKTGYETTQRVDLNMSTISGLNNNVVQKRDGNITDGLDITTGKETKTTRSVNRDDLLIQISSRLRAGLKNIFNYIKVLFSDRMSTMGKVFATISMMGVLFAIIKRDNKNVILLSLVAGYLILQPIVVPAVPRAVVMVYPVLFLLSARFLVAVKDRLLFFKKDSNLFSVSLIFLLCLPNIVELTKFNRQLLRKDTRVLAQEWIEKNIPPGSHLFISNFHLGGYIRLNESIDSLNSKYLKYKSVIDNLPNYKGSALRRKKIEMANVREPSYFINYYNRPAGRQITLSDDFTQFIAKASEITLDDYSKKGYDYIITARYNPSDNYSSQYLRKHNIAYYEFFKSLDRDWKLEKSFTYENSLDKSRRPKINPEINIYSLR